MLFLQIQIDILIGVLIRYGIRKLRNHHSHGEEDQETSGGEN